MEKHIILENKKISYTLRKSLRARRVRLAVRCDGSVVVTSPFYLRKSVIERFIQEKSQWIFSKIAFFGQFQKSPIAQYGKADYLKYKKQALDLVTERVKYFNDIYYKYSFSKINVKNQKTRWGSCSNKGNLSFNYKMLFLSPEARDYIIVHEICHLKELNHSNKFWDLVMIACPEYKKIKKELKHTGLSFY